MTILAWDGKVLVADGKSTRRMPDTGDYDMLNLYDSLKIRPLKKEWNYEDDLKLITFTAIGQTGSAVDSKNLTTLFLSMQEQGNPLWVMNQLKCTLKDKFDTTLIMVGTCFDKRCSETIPYIWPAFGIGRDSLITSKLPIPKRGTQQFQAFGSGRIKLVKTIDVGEHLLEDALDYVSLSIKLYPQTCGGLITRYDPMTRTLDHPEPVGVDVLKEALTLIKEKEFFERNKFYDDIFKRL